MKLTLNDATLKFITEFETNVESGTPFTNKELIELLNATKYNNEQFDTYIDTAKSKSIWWALTRSGKWTKVKPGEYIKNEVTSSMGYRADYIKSLSENLYEVLLLKNRISDDGLRNFLLSPKGIGEDLFYLTVSYYKRRGVKGKHKISDFITDKARAILDSGDKVSNKLKYEHMVPKNIYIKRITQVLAYNEITVDFIYELLDKYYFTCTVTTE